MGAVKICLAIVATPALRCHYLQRVFVGLAFSNTAMEANDKMDFEVTTQELSTEG